MASNEPDAKQARKALQQHRVIQRLLQAVVRFITAGPGHSAETIQTLDRDLKNLQAYMGSHFEQEEAGGLFEDILERLPMVDAAVQDLRQEHKEFIEDLKGLIQRLESPEVKEIEAIRSDLNIFVSTFYEHEATENGLLQQAYNLDIGSPD